MPPTVSNETTIDDPALIERVAIAIFEKTQGSWEYAREADREWLDFRRLLELILQRRRANRPFLFLRAQPDPGLFGDHPLSATQDQRFPPRPRSARQP